MTATIEKRVYTVGEIMEILGISHCTAYALIKSGQFKSVKVGKGYRISKVSFDNWLNENDFCQLCD